MAIVNRTGLARDLGANLSTVDQWVRKGCPVIVRGTRGKEWQFDTAAVHAWYTQQKIAEATGAVQTDEAELKRRKLEAETKLAELELDKATGNVVEVEYLHRNLSGLFAEIRTNIRNLPDRVVTALIGMTDEREFKAVLLKEIDIILTDLSEMAVFVEPDDEQSDDAS